MPARRPPARELDDSLVGDGASRMPARRPPASELDDSLVGDGASRVPARALGRFDGRGFGQGEGVQGEDVVPVDA